MISVIVCTYNRCDSLRQTLATFSRVEGCWTVPWELLVIDNNSHDRTKEVVAEFAATVLPLRYVFEQRQGLSNARNRGIEEARGDIIAFTDDDVLIDTGWLENLQKAYHELDATCIGGKILPHWEAPPPSWLGEELHGQLALLDLGNERMRLTQPTLWGANLTFRADALRKFGCFDTNLGRTGSKLYGNEEIRLLQGLIDSDAPVYYCPEILVHHCVPEKRMQKSYFRKWYFDDGELNGFLLGHYRYRNFRGIPLYLIRQFFLKSFDYLFKVIKRSEDRFSRQLDLAYRLGFMAGRVKFSRNTK